MDDLALRGSDAFLRPCALTSTVRLVTFHYKYKYTSVTGWLQVSYEVGRSCES